MGHDSQKTDRKRSENGIRDSHGRFVKGHPGGPGRPRRQTEEAYLELFRKAVSADEWLAVIRRALEDAKQGDKAARQFLAEYLIGKPTEYVVSDVSVDGPLTVRLEWDA